MTSQETKTCQDGPAPGELSVEQILPRSLSGGSFDASHRRLSAKHLLLLAGGGLLLTFYLLGSAGDLTHVGEVLRSNTNRLAWFLVLTHVYLLLKGLALRRAAMSSGVRISLLRAARVFCESAVVSLAVAKIASDVYKYARLGTGSRADRVRAVLVYRAAAIIAVLILSVLVAILWAERYSWRTHLAWLVPVAVVVMVAHGFRNRVTDWVREHGVMLLEVLPFSIGALLAKIAGLAVLLGVSMDGEVIEVAAAFLLIGSLASMAQVPAGLGMLDAGYAVFLTRFAGASGAETAAFLISFRLLGPVYTSLLGLSSLLAASFSRADRRDLELDSAAVEAG